MSAVSRREVLRGAGAAVVLGVSGAELARVAQASATSTTGNDASASTGGTGPGRGSLLAELERVLALERVAEFAYARQVVRSPGAGRSLLLTFHAHERAHRLRLAAELVARSPEPVSPRDPRIGPVRGVVEADRLLAAAGISGSLAHGRKVKALLGLLLRIENALEAGYLQLLSRPDADAPLVELCASILAVEAQHASLVRLLRTPGKLEAAVPASFVVGPR